MKVKMLISKVLVCLFAASSVLLPTTNFSVQAKTLHPLGLNTLHENIKGIQKAPELTGKYKSNESLPSSVDLTSQFPSVKNQGSLGSCVTFATTYAKTYEENKKRSWGVNILAHYFSPSYIYDQIHADYSADGGGSNFSDAFTLLENQGDTSIVDMPYDGESYGYLKNPTRKQRLDASKYKAISWEELNNGDYNEMKQYLASGTPVVIGIPVYSDFDNLSPSNPIYDVVSGTSRGGHALCIIGYDDSKQAVKIINSWGTDWGLKGYGWISYNLLKSLQVEAYVLND